MNWKELYNMQERLDAYILDNHDLEGKNLFEEKYLAFLVELGELANETRCFKYWSKKKPSAREVVLAEYVDGLHFLLSIGLVKSYKYSGENSSVIEGGKTEQFNQVFTYAAHFKDAPSVRTYTDLFAQFIALGKVLGFTKPEVYEAYMKKNEINYERQDSGY